MITRFFHFILLLFVRGNPLIYQKKQCDIAVLIDPFFRNYYGDNSQNVILKNLGGANQVFNQNLGVQLSVSTFIYLDDYFAMNSRTSKQLLTKIQNSMMRNELAHMGVFPGSHCLVQVYTFQNFMGNLGESFTGSINGGICSLNFNIGVINSNNNNMPISQDFFVETIAHETGHSFGAGHDIGSCNNQRVPFIMNSEIKGGPNRNIFSKCSLNSIMNQIQTKTCLRAIM